jgi:glycosyltransferase involved in cell wall biosynthesis
MIEAMACGTPVVAFRCGSVPEVVEHGTTGLIVDSMAEAVAAVEKVSVLDRAAVRRRFEERFSADRMARDYVAIYRKLQSGRRHGLGSARPGEAYGPAAETGRVGTVIAGGGS